MFDSIVLSILIGSQLFGIQLFLNKMRKTIEEISNRFENEVLSNEFRNQIQRNFTNSILYYVIILLVISPFLIMQMQEYSSKGICIFYYGEEPSNYAFILDIYDNSLNYIALYLLAILLWMIINISWVLDTINSTPYNENLRVNIFNADKMGGFRFLRDLIISYSIYYSLIILLFVMSWVVPVGGYGSDPYGYKLVPWESKFLEIFWIIGIAFFIGSWSKIRKFSFGKFKIKINRISDLCQYKTDQLLSNLLSNDYSDETEKRLDQISKALDALHKERERIIKLDPRPMDTKTIIFYLFSSIPSLIAIIKTAEDASSLQVVHFLMNNTQNITTYLKTMLNLTFPH